MHARRLRALAGHVVSPAAAGAPKDPADLQLHHNFATIGEGTIVEPGADVGWKYHRDAGPARVGKNSIIRRGSVIYGDTDLGDYFQTGHNATVRARVRCGDYCTVFVSSRLRPPPSTALSSTFIATQFH